VAEFPQGDPIAVRTLAQVHDQELRERAREHHDRIPHLRWKIGALLGFGVRADYFDYVNMFVAAPQLQQFFHLGPAQIGLFGPSAAPRLRAAAGRHLRGAPKRQRRVVRERGDARRP